MSGRLILPAALAVLFAGLAAAVRAGGAAGFDRAVLLALRVPGDPSDPIGPRWLEELVRDVTALGGTGILAFLALAVSGFLLAAGHRRAALAAALAVAGAMLLSHGLKWGFDRPRPDLVPHGMAVYTRSFPSGHAMLSAATYLTLGAMLGGVQRRRAAQVFPVALAALVTVLVGGSRVYLGVHWPTDVLAGWAAGAAWAAASLLLLRRWLLR